MFFILSAVVNGAIISYSKATNGYVQFVNGLIFQFIYINCNAMPNANTWYTFAVPIDRLYGEYSHVIITYNHFDSQNSSRTENFAVYWDYTSIFKLIRESFTGEPAGRLTVLIRSFY